MGGGRGCERGWEGVGEVVAEGVEATDDELSQVPGGRVTNSRTVLRRK